MEGLKVFWNPDAFEKYENSHDSVGTTVGRCKDRSNYHIMHKVGEGTYGVVYKAQEKNTKKMYALKRLRPESDDRDGVDVTTIREILLLQRCRHPNIVSLKEVLSGKDSESVYVVFEYYENDLGKIYDTYKRPFSLSEIKTILIQILRAVAYLHDNWIFHRDVKISNFLYSKGEVVLCDFGLARTFGDINKEFTPHLVTLWYRCPELLLGEEEYTTAIDMWSVGCIFAELFNGTPLFGGSTEPEQLVKIFKLLGSPSEKIWPGWSKLPGAKMIKYKQEYLKIVNNINCVNKCRYSDLGYKFHFLGDSGIDLLNRMLTFDPKKRISAKAALEHRYFVEDPLPKPIEDMPIFEATKY